MAKPEFTDSYSESQAHLSETLQESLQTIKECGLELSRLLLLAEQEMRRIESRVFALETVYQGVSKNKVSGGDINATVSI